MIVHFITDGPFRMLSIPNSPEQQKELEDSLLQTGCREPIYVWKEIILDGYKRYAFCHDEGIDFIAAEMSFSSESEAICWVCKRKIPDFEKKSAAYYYLVGRYYNAAKIWRREARLSSDIKKSPFESPDPGRISILVGKELGLNHCTIENYGTYARSLDRIYERSRNLFEAILGGSIQIPMRETKRVAYLPEEEFQKVLKNRYHIIEERAEAGPKMRRRRKKSPAPKKEERPLSVGIKDMPAFDPDMELRGLAFTIPTWMQSIDRAEKKTDMNLVSDGIKKQLADTLKQLEKEIRQMLEALQ